MLKNFVIIIRSNKTGIYNNILDEEEKEIVNQQILDAIWYPYDYYKSLFSAVAKIEAEGDPKKIEQWDFNYAKQAVDRIHKRTTRKRSLRHAITSYNALIKMWFNFGVLKENIISDNEINVEITEFDNEFDFHYYILMGWLRAFYGSYLDTSVSGKFLQKSWEGYGNTIINLTWNS